MPSVRRALHCLVRALLIGGPVKLVSIGLQKAHGGRLEAAMLHKISNGWLQNNEQTVTLLITFLFFASFYLGFVL